MSLMVSSMDDSQLHYGHAFCEDIIFGEIVAELSLNSEFREPDNPVHSIEHVDFSQSIIPHVSGNDTVVASWSLIQEVAGSPFRDNMIIIDTIFSRICEMKTHFHRVVGPMAIPSFIPLDHPLH